jgi:hypothetical protein
MYSRQIRILWISDKYTYHTYQKNMNETNRKITSFNKDNFSSVLDIAKYTAWRALEVSQRSDKILDFIRSIYKPGTAEPTRINLIWSSVVRIEFYFPQYNAMNIWLSDDHVSVVQDTSAIVKWGYILWAHVILAWGLVVEENGDQIKVGEENFGKFASEALYMDDSRKFPVMAVCWEHYVFDFYIKDIESNQNSIRIKYGYEWIVCWETTVLISLKSLSALSLRWLEKYRKQEERLRPMAGDRKSYSI